jgi:hypothetical protein
VISKPLPIATYATTAALIFNGFVITVQPLSAQESENAEKYTIQIIRGANLVNSVKRRVATEPIVEVQDRNKKPVGGVILTFTLPDTGPSGTFAANGSHIATVTTGVDGRAIMPPFQTNDVEGSYNITVSGSKDGETFSTTISVTNVAGAAAISHGALLKIAIVAAVAAGVSAGIVATQGGSSKTTITPGTPTVGPAVVVHR